VAPLIEHRSKFIFSAEYISTESEMAKLHTLVVGRLQTNCYILQSDSTALVIDPGDEPERILRFLDEIAVKPSHIIATHTHFDHVLGVNTIRNKLNIPFLIHRDDLSMLESMQSRVRQFMGFSVPPPPKVDQFLTDGESITIGQDRVKVIHTPGHSPGSVSLVGQGFVLTGDALFNQSIGRTDLPGGDFDTLVRSIAERLFSLEDDTLVYPGHGPETSIGDEKLANPFVGRVSKHIR
jgi:glyoxylase-like metal-dependent hydrolase (beta-lactamase superfamily II)